MPDAALTTVEPGRYSVDSAEPMRLRGLVLAATAPATDTMIDSVASATTISAIPTSSPAHQRIKALKT
ncbi:hypothetical protein ABTW96_23635 [Nocardia beijingensis]|uniref:hypothetical protein n=1 Tax=Nocardia beijingensis TaxID=95162 RepID=UPI00332A95A0